MSDPTAVDDMTDGNLVILVCNQSSQRVNGSESNALTILRKRYELDRLEESASGCALTHNVGHVIDVKSANLKNISSTLCNAEVGD